MKFIHRLSITLFILFFPLPISAAQNYGVILHDANLRSGPGTQFKAETVLGKGTKVEEKKRQDNWLLIKVPSLDKTGWVHYQLVQNQPRKKFYPVKTIKPTAVKTTPPPAPQTKQQLTPQKPPVAEIKEETLLTAKIETVTPEASQTTLVQEIIKKSDKAESKAIVALQNTAPLPEPLAKQKNQKNPEPQAVPTVLPHIDKANTTTAGSPPTPPATIEAPMLPSGIGYNRSARPVSVIGIIDIQKVINNSKRGKAAREKYEKLRLAGQKENIDLAEEELITNVIIEIQAIVETFALQHGFTHILNKNSGAVFYNNSSYSITDDIIREYDRQISLKHITP